jgi:hypothetical protein
MIAAASPRPSSSITATRRMARDGMTGVPCFLAASSQGQSTPVGGIIMPLIPVNRTWLLSFHAGNNPQS